MSLRNSTEAEQIAKLKDELRRERRQNAIYQNSVRRLNVAYSDTKTELLAYRRMLLPTSLGRLFHSMATWAVLAVRG
jgi:hypothetical protein